MAIGHPFVTGIDLAKANGKMNWTVLRLEIEKAMRLVEEDQGTPGLVQRIEIQIQGGAK